MAGILGALGGSSAGAGAAGAGAAGTAGTAAGASGALGAGSSLTATGALGTAGPILQNAFGQSFAGAPSALAQTAGAASPSWGSLASAFLNPQATPSYANIASAIGQGHMPAIPDVLRYLLHSGGNQELFSNFQIGGAPQRRLPAVQPIGHFMPKDTIGGVLGTL